MSIAGLVARWNVADDVRAGRLVQIKIQGVEPEPLAVWAVYPTTRMLLPKVRAFIEYLFAHGENIYPSQGNAFHKDKYRGIQKPTYIAVESDKIKTIHGVLEEVTEIFQVIGSILWTEIRLP